VKLAEPATAITDYILFIECMILGALLLRHGIAGRQMSVCLWGMAFIATAIAAVAGGSFHGLAPVITEILKKRLWKITVYSIAISTAFMFCGTVYSSVPLWLRPWFLGAAFIQFVICMWVVSRNDEFRYLVYNYAPVMLIVLILQIINRYHYHGPGSGWIVSGILVSFAAAAIQQTSWKLHENFNHNDIYHTIQMVAMYLLYRGAFLLRDF